MEYIIIGKEIEWCERNIGSMPTEFRKGFIAGLKQAIYLLSAAEQRNEAESEEQTCPSCGGSGIGRKIGLPYHRCTTCKGAGHV